MCRRPFQSPPSQNHLTLQSCCDAGLTAASRGSSAAPPLSGPLPSCEPRRSPSHLPDSTAVFIMFLHLEGPPWPCCYRGLLAFKAQPNAPSHIASVPGGDCFLSFSGTSFFYYLNAQIPLLLDDKCLSSLGSLMSI